MNDFQKTSKPTKKASIERSYGSNVQWPHDSMSSVGIAKPAQMIPNRDEQ
jgi:hypothetical protein